MLAIVSAGRTIMQKYTYICLPTVRRQIGLVINK